MIDPTSGWVHCPSSGMAPVLLGNFQARCPLCDWVFTTMMDEPVLPRHFFNADGDVLIAPGER